MFSSFLLRCHNAHHYKLAAVALLSASHVVASTSADANKKEEEELFEGQCLKRQLHRPNVPYPAWDYNWDGRMTPETSLEGHKSGQSRTVSGTTRHIILVRHGQYDETSDDDALRKLTPLGRRQAQKTGKRLAEIVKGSDQFEDPMFHGPCTIQAIHVSNMIRAKETATLIAQQMKLTVQRPDPDLNEALPAPMIPIRPDITGATEEIDEHHERIEQAFQKYIYRSTNRDDDAQEEFEIIVCHGNVIRYFFCRALQLPPEAWLRMSIFNCSLTYLMVRPNGSVSARMLGDIGHLDYEESTFSGFHGFKW